MNASYLHNGSNQEVINICEQIIGLNDIILEPYLTLSYIYHDYGDYYREYIVKQVAAKILKTNSVMWVECARLANLPSIQELVNAKKFYNRALKHCSKTKDRKAYI
jgi:hypothetical protein